MATYKIHEAKAKFSALIEKAMLGEEVIIAKGATPVALVTPITVRKKRTAGSAKGKVRMARDFDAPLGDFDEYK